MRKLCIKTGILAIIFLVNQTCLAHALTLTPYLGAYRFEGNSNVGDTFLSGLGVDFQLTDNFFADLIYLKGDADLNYFDLTNRICVTDESIDTNIFHISGRYRLLKNETFKNFMPYVTTGLGIFSMDSDYAEMFQDHPDRHYLFQFHYGGGIQYAFTDKLSFRGDLRHMISFDNMDNDLSAILGISYTFGTPQKKHKKVDHHKKHEKNISPKTKANKTIKTKHPEKHDTTESQPKKHAKAKSPTKTQPEQETSAQVELESKEEIHSKTQPSQQISKKSQKTPKTDVIVISEPLPKENLGTKTTPTTNHMASHKEQQTVHQKSHIVKKPDNELKMVHVDTDADGILDHVDKCPDTPSNVRVNMFGCAPDHDRDGVIDVLDHCPNTPIKTKVDKNGCQINIIIMPDKHLKTIRKKTQKYQTTIEFDYKSAQVKDIYFGQLSRIKYWMKKLVHPVLIINSHTDNIGSHIYNINLSDKRAESVKEYLHRHFHIPYHLIRTYNFGESQPVADNSTEKGRQKNRRAEIVVTEKQK